MPQFTAPAKINLFLHITGRRDDGYHTLQSLMAFCDVGDGLDIVPAPKFRLTVTGPFADACGPVADNLVTRAAKAMEEAADRAAAISVTLHKNLPPGAGLGGGSSDAACVMQALNRLWGQPLRTHTLKSIGLKLGAEMPVCLEGRPCLVEGAGEIITPVPDLPALHGVLVWPGKPLKTPDVFRAFTDAPVYSNPAGFSGPQDDWQAVINATGNNLTAAAASLLPDVQDALASLGKAGGKAVRMSGSGSTCFGLFDTRNVADTVARDMAAAHPQWWVRAFSLT